MTNEERKAALEAIIYAADEPATVEQLSTALGDEKLAVQSSLDELVASYASEGEGAHGKSFGRASFDRVTSIFANVEARQDAENRAAQSVGEELRTRLLAVLSTTT